MRFLPLLLATISLGMPLSVCADRLDAVLEAAEKVKSAHEGGIRDRKDMLPGDVDPESSYGRLFTDTSTKEQIFLWLGDPPESYTAGRPRLRDQKELIAAERTFMSSRKKEVTVEVLIPHPAYISMVQFDLLKDFTRHLPAQSLIESSEKMDFKGFPGTLYRLKEGICSVVIKMTKETMVVSHVKSCDNIRELTDVTRALDLKRLDAKLTS